MSSVVERYRLVNARIANACERAKRDPLDITLIAVSKTYSAEMIEPLLALGHRDFGENYVQETQDKWPDLKARYPDARLHLIGPLQSNKARLALSLFDVLHSLDRDSLLRALVKEMRAASRFLPCFVQVNIGEEPQKSGVLPDALDAFLASVRQALPASCLLGLMCIPPAAEVVAPHFLLLKQLAAQHSLPALSMGMSADFETAILLGATHVRVGTALFGSREALLTAPPRTPISIPPSIISPPSSYGERARTHVRDGDF